MVLSYLCLFAHTLSSSWNVPSALPQLCSKILPVELRRSPQCVHKDVHHGVLYKNEKRRTSKMPTPGGLVGYTPGHVTCEILCNSTKCDVGIYSCGMVSAYCQSNQVSKQYLWQTVHFRKKKVCNSPRLRKSMAEYKKTNTQKNPPKTQVRWW